jgi:hypothetical protein
MGRSPRIARAGGGYDLTKVPGDAAADTYTSLEAITTELRRRGFTAANKRYLIYAAVNRGGVCGEGEYPDPLGTVARYAAVYLDSAASCGARDFGGGTAASAGKSDTIAAHEWLHNEGVAPLLAPHTCASSPYHVCTGPLWLGGDIDPEAHDVVFPIITARLSTMVLDRDRDDYLDHPWPHIPNLRDSVWLE